jgi:uncharacterized phage-associated protein
MSTIPVQTLSDYLIREMAEYGAPLTNLWLQKLLYYCQAWHLAELGEPLFDSRIEAWVHGPVVVGEYHRFKDYGYNPLPVPGEPIELPQPSQELVDRVLDTYGPLNAYSLELLTHSEAPWNEARGVIPAHEPSSQEITLDSMRKFYVKMRDEQKGKTTAKG